MSKRTIAALVLKLLGVYILVQAPHVSDAMVRDP